jgi:hypothetical protein
MVNRNLSDHAMSPNERHKIHWTNGLSSMLLVVLADTEVDDSDDRETLGTWEEREAWRKAHPTPTLAIVVTGSMGGCCAIAFDGVGGWSRALAEGERSKITRDDRELGATKVDFEEATRIANEYALQWYRGKDRFPGRCDSRRIGDRPGPSVWRCEKQRDHEGPHFRSMNDGNGVEWVDR